MTEKNHSEQEIDRLRREYARRESDEALSDKYSQRNPAYAYMIERRQQAVSGLLQGRLRRGLAEVSVLEVGCGSGGVLSEFVSFGANPRALFGVDLLADRLALAHQNLPNSSFVCGDGQHLAFPTDSVDLLLQFTAFSSILDPSVKKQMAQEMYRVLTPGGAILWYDFIWNPTNRHTRGIPTHEVKCLFPACDISANRITLAPPLAKFLLPKLRPLADFLTSMRWLNSHLLLWIEKK